MCGLRGIHERKVLRGVKSANARPFYGPGIIPGLSIIFFLEGNNNEFKWAAKAYNVWRT